MRIFHKVYMILKEPRWTAADVRRYGYWSVFAGAFGYTYGHNSVMQMYKKTDLNQLMVQMMNGLQP